MGAVTVQILVTLLLSVLVYIIAFGVVWPSYALRMLEAEDSPLGYKITKSDGNLLGSIAMLGSLASMTIVGYVNEKFGRKRTVILTGLCLTLAWSIMATAKNVTQLVIGRFLSGVGGGMHVVTALVFISEISQTNVKGPLLSLSTFAWCMGALVSYVEGWFCSYEVINYINITICAAFVLLVLCLKETPQHLMRNGMEKEALLSLKFYRGAATVNQEILDELAYLRSQQQRTDNNDISGVIIENEKEKLNQEKDNEQECNTEQNNWKILLKSKSSQRAIILTSMFMIMSVCMGMIGIQAYAGQLFGRAVPGLSPDLCSVILAVVTAISSGVAIVVTDLIPRRVLMISSCLMAAVCMAALGTMLRWSWAPEWGIPFMIVSYCFFFQIGAVNVPFVQTAECVPPQIKSLGSATSMCSMFLANFLVLFLFHPTEDLLGLDGVFFAFAIISLLTAAMAYFFMRETRKVPIEIVQEMFEDGYLYRRHSLKKVPTTVT